MHWVPQVPQLALAVSRLAQVPLQLVVPVGQAHCPLWHNRTPEQIEPHRPQLFLSDVRSTQVFPQGLRPEVHVITQVPAAQRGAVAGQRWPQVPQLASLVWRSTQVFPQTL